jgi:uncharacterized protein DUF3293
MPDPDLEAAYRDTDYRVDDGPFGPFVIRIGEVSPAADRVLALHGQSNWAFITACNPHSERLPPEENARRMSELQAVCLDHGWRHYTGAGVGRDGSWPAEPTFFVIGISESEAIEVARRFGQNAIVAGRAGSPARLIWTGSPVS